jgi:hypothetical protein
VVLCGRVVMKIKDLSKSTRWALGAAGEISEVLGPA